VTTPIHVREVDAHAGRGGDPSPLPPPRGSLLWRPLGAAAITTIAVTALSWLVPDYAGTLVGLTFLAATWILVLRRDEQAIRAHGLSLAGLLEPVSIDPKRLAREAWRSLLWVLLFVAIFFPPFWLAYERYWSVTTFALRLPPSIGDEVLGQVLVTALPEEAFFRGYLQTSLDAAWPPRWRVLGATLGPSWIVTAAIFAVGHLLTIHNPARLAVFFPALLFGWLRARTGGIGASVGFHASCNLFSATLARGYGLA